MASAVNEALTRNLGQDQSGIQPTINPGELSATLTFSGQTIAARAFPTETAVADDQDGLPVLNYVKAYFSVPADLEDDVGELEDIVNGFWPSDDAYGFYASAKPCLAALGTAIAYEVLRFDCEDCA